MTDQLPDGAYAFDWHRLDMLDDDQEFLSWLTVNLLSEHDVLNDADPRFDNLINRVGEASDHFNDVVMTVQFNGIDVNAEHLVRALYQVYRDGARREAARVLAETTELTELYDLVDALRRDVKLKVRRVAGNLGITIPDEED